MPPILALILCTIFVLWLLNLERRSSRDCSLALWLPVIWFLLIASKPLAVWFPIPFSEDEYGSPLDRNFITILMVGGILVLLTRRFAFSKAIKENIWLILLIVYMLISTLWSDIFFVSFKRWVRALPALIMAFVLLSEKNPREAMLSVLRRTTYILIPFSILLIKYFPYYGVVYGRWSGELMWVGVTMQKNGLGRLCLTATFFLIWSLIKRRREHDIPIVKHQTAAEIFLLFLSLYLLKGPSIYAMSATAVTTLVIALLVFIGLLWMKKSKIFPSANILSAFILMIIFFGIMTVFYSGSNISGFTSAVGRDTTLTGRSEIWQSLLPVAMQHPFGGHGYGGFWTPETLNFFRVGEAHSGYLDVLIDIGFMGLILVSLFLLSSCHRARQMMKADFYWASLWICLLIMSAIHNITESSLNILASQLTAMLVFFAVSSSAIVPEHKKTT